MAVQLSSERVGTLHLSDYIHFFRESFRRSDQVQWATVYLQGLLEDIPRKNIGGMADCLRKTPALDARDVAQALQNFIHNSNWDEKRLLATYWKKMGVFQSSIDRALVVVDLTFPKQGRHSVGVQRQLSREFGRKMNCQLAVALFLATPWEALPLNFRLYLPKNWLDPQEKRGLASIPKEFHLWTSKVRIAQQLLEEVREAGLIPGQVIVQSGYEGIQEGLPDWENVLVRARFGEDDDQVRPYLEAVQKSCQLMKDRLGLGHFEGRSWRGFHRHIALVVLALGYLALRKPGLPRDFPKIWPEHSE